MVGFSRWLQSRVSMTPMFVQDRQGQRVEVTQNFLGQRRRDR